MADTYAGLLLVAGPRLIDPNFWRTVVLVCEHNDDGALGLVINRPTDIAVGDHLPGWTERLVGADVVFVGGPVQPTTAIGLGRRGDSEPPGWSGVAGAIGLVDLTLAPGDVVGDLLALRVFSGYAGWSPGQLEAEVATGDWVLVAAEPADAFTGDPEGLWTTVLKREGGGPGMYAHFPLDPSAN